MARLTDMIRKQICEKAIKHAMTAVMEELAAREKVLASKAYDEIVPEKLRKALANVPPGWVEHSKVVTINANGWQAKLNIGREVPVQQNHKYGNALGSPSPETADEIQKLVQDKQSASETGSEMHAKMKSFLATFNTFNQLRDRWPDGKEFYEEFDTDNKPALPSVRVAEINSMLGLPAEE